jgi:ankyrin repeat protein
MYAVGAAHYDAARRLLEGGADPGAEASSGFGVLCAAVCARGYFPDTTGELVIRPFPEDRVLPVVELLLRWGADDSLDSTGLRPSHRAEGLGYFAIVRILFDYSGEEEYRSAG